MSYLYKGYQELKRQLEYPTYTNQTKKHQNLHINTTTIEKHNQTKGSTSENTNIQTCTKLKNITMPNTKQKTKTVETKC